MTVFCLQCSSNSCLHLQASTRNMLSSREQSVLRGLVDPKFGVMKELAFDLGLTVGTLKVYTGKIYRKLGWPGGTIRQLTLWAIAHREQLGLSLPTAEQFPQISPVESVPAASCWSITHQPITI